MVFEDDYYCSYLFAFVVIYLLLLLFVKGLFVAFVMLVVVEKTHFMYFLYKKHH